MAISRSREVVDFDAGAACDAARETAGDALLSFVEFDAERFNPIYVADAALAGYEDEEHCLAHFERIHSYVHVDFAEMDLLVEDLFAVADRVEYLVTATDAFTLVRVYVGDQGLFLALEPGEPVDPVVAAIRGVVGDA